MSNAFLKVSLAFVICCSTIAHAGVVNVVQKNVVVALKGFEEGAESVKGDTISQPVSTFTVKARDIIDVIGERDSIFFGKSAKLVYREYFDADGEYLGYAFFITEKGFSDYDVTSSFSLYNVLASASQYKYSISKGTGTYTWYASDEFTVTLGEFAFAIRGFAKTSGKTTIANGAFVDVDGMTTQMAGEGYIWDGSGYVPVAVLQGKFDLTGPKIMK